LLSLSAKAPRKGRRKNSRDTSVGVDLLQHLVDV
jgi:hypothetical protein